LELSNFISSLLADGKVSVKGHLISFNDHDLAASKKILYEYFKEDILEMPHPAPEFSENAAIWAAEYLYKTTQITVLRDVGEDVINEHLKPFDGEQNASVIYSADLMLRYLPQLFELAKGLAPADILVQVLKKTASQWPYSSVGIELNETTDDNLIFEHPSLKYTYIDRIIHAKDSQRSKTEMVARHIREVGGEHITLLWPRFENL